MKNSTTTRIGRFFVALWLGIGALLTALAAEPPRHSYVEGELLVKFEGGVGGPAARHVRQAMNHEVRRSFNFTGWQRIRLPRGMGVEEGLARYRKMPGVLAVEPNYFAQAQSTQAAAAPPPLTPSDPRFSEQWALPRIGASAAWNVSTGSTNVVVAVIDSGINYNHEDLRDNMWRNPDEIPANGLDDDANGYVDDIYGIDTADDQFGNDSDPLDQGTRDATFYHGSSCAGIIGAVGNNAKGITGVNWSVQLMALRALRTTNGTSQAEIIEALEYCVMMKHRGVNINVINLSFGATNSFSQAAFEGHRAVADAGILQVAAAGNSGTDNDVQPLYPASYDIPLIISVANSDQSDALWIRSHYGRTSVDLAAPGRSIVTTIGPETNVYTNSFNGSSGSCAHVAGAAALLFAARSNATPAQVKRALLQSVDMLPSFTNKMVSHGRLNIGRAMQAVTELHVPTEYATIQEAIDTAVSGDTIRIAAGDYYEQIVIVNKNNLTLVGEPGTVLHATTGMTQKLLPEFDGYAVVAVHRSDVVISSLEIVGNSLAETYGKPLNGVDFFGASGLVTNCIITDFRGIDTITEATRGRGVHCFNPVSAGTSVANVVIVNSTFTNNQIAIHLRGDPGQPQTLRTTAKVQGNTIVGHGLVQGGNLGIFIICGVAAELIGNQFSDFAGASTYDCAGVGAFDAAAQNRGRFAALLPITCEGNTFSNCGQGLWFVGGNESRIINNKFVGTVQGTFLPRALGVSGTNIVVANNDFAGLPKGIMPVDENWSPPWPALPRVANLTLSANWFCGVSEIIRTNPLVIGLQEQGTERCENVGGTVSWQPVFQSIRPRTGGAALALRSWHEQAVIIETSTDLQHWVPVHTNAMNLPAIEIQLDSAVVPHRFYRVAKPGLGGG